MFTTYSIVWVNILHFSGVTSGLLFLDLTTNTSSLNVTRFLCFAINDSSSLSLILSLDSRYLSLSNSSNSKSAKAV